MRIEEGAIKLDYDDVLLKPKRSRLLSRSEVTLVREFKFPHSPFKWRGVPIIASNMDTVGTFNVAEILKEFQMLTCIHKHYTFEEWKLNAYDKLFPYIMISQGIQSADLKKTCEIVQHFELELTGIPVFLCLDVANGYSEQFAAAVEDLRLAFQSFIIVAGNVATGEMTEELILKGADVVKVGIGPGSACATRNVTGVGYPQLSAVMECADAAHGLNGHIIADGGCKAPGDVAKAFGAGADFVMLGSMLAGYDETGTEFYGMSSHKAQLKYGGAIKDYRASEGLEMQVEPKGALSSGIKQILGGVRSAATYIGARELKHMPKCATFIRCNRVK